MAGEADSERLRFLVLSIVNPQVEYNGAATVTRGLLELLKLTSPGSEIDFIPVRKTPRKWRRVSQAFSFGQSLSSALPAKALFLSSRQFLEQVTSRIKGGRWDAVIVNGADLLWIADYLPLSIPRILVAHNIEHLLFCSRVRQLNWTHLPLTPLLRVELEKLRNFELEGIRRAGNVIFLSTEDASYATSHCRGLRSVVIPPLFDYAPPEREPKPPTGVLEIGYIGNFAWWPNQLGLRWFAHEVLPHVTSPIRLNLFGRGSRRRYGDARIVGHGEVEAVDGVWENCDFLICPKFSDSGVSVKLAEAAYNRVSVLANRRATLGLGISHDPALILRDEPKEWVTFLNSVAARDLAGRCVAERTAARFSLQPQKSVLRNFVQDVISNQTVYPAQADSFRPLNSSVAAGSYSRVRG